MFGGTRISEEGIHELVAVFEKLGAEATKQTYPNIGHTIIQEKIDLALKMVQEIPISCLWGKVTQSGQ